MKPALRRAAGLALVAVLASWPVELPAHTATMTSARVTLRTGHVEVRIAFDPLRMLEAENTTGAPVALLAMVDPDAFAALVAQTTGAITAGVTLAADGKAIALTLRRASGADALRESIRQVMAARSAGEHAHAARAEVVLEARLPIRPKGFALQLPTLLGATTTTWVEPTTAVTPAGGISTWRPPPHPTAPAP